MADEFCLKMPDFHVTFRDLLHAVNLRHGTNVFTSLPKEGVLRIFFALKNPTASAGFEPANLFTKGQHATSRLPKPQKTCMLLWLRKFDYSPYEDRFIFMGCFVSVACIFLLCVCFANILRKTVALCQARTVLVMVF